jgi:hypothetical protein
MDTVNKPVKYIYYVAPILWIFDISSLIDITVYKPFLFHIGYIETFGLYYWTFASPHYVDPLILKNTNVVVYF